MLLKPIEFLINYFDIVSILHLANPSFFGNCFLGMGVLFIIVAVSSFVIVLVFDVLTIILMAIYRHIKR